MYYITETNKSFGQASHQEDLLADWELAVNGKKPFPIKGLDQ